MKQNKNKKKKKTLNVSYYSKPLRVKKYYFSRAQMEENVFSYNVSEFTVATVKINNMHFKRIYTVRSVYSALPLKQHVLSACQIDHLILQLMLNVNM